MLSTGMVTGHLWSCSQWTDTDVMDSQSPHILTLSNWWSPANSLPKLTYQIPLLNDQLYWCTRLAKHGKTTVFYLPFHHVLDSGLFLVSFLNLCFVRCLQTTHEKKLCNHQVWKTLVSVIKVLSLSLNIGSGIWVEGWI